ncbi:MAG: hypothetical protein M0Z41_15435 [Peptococcaceae bacterium]|jgi:integrase/recombinase XerC|nr:hypothetical protein [Peptococcaceae bacterium]
MAPGILQSKLLGLADLLNLVTGGRRVDQGVSLDKVAVLAGHSKLNTSAKYVRPSVQDLEKAVDRLSWE